MVVSTGLNILNGKMMTIKTIPGMGGRGDKGEL
jgi:hypothetical protein